MVKLKDDKTCACNLAGSDAEPVRVLCRFGYCTIWYCPACNMELVQAGPIACPHKKNENGTLRQFKYPDMETKTHPAVKENTMRKQKRSHKRK